MISSRITISSDQMVGVPYVRNSGIPVASILELVQQEMTESEILQTLPSLELEDIQAVKQYALSHKIPGRLISIEQIQKLCQTIGESFKPEKIILFGSYAYGTPHRGSDIDLLIIMDFEGRSVDKALEIWQTVQPSFAVDLIIRTPEEVKWRYQQFDPLIRHALDQGQVMYERDCARVAS